MTISIFVGNIAYGAMEKEIGELFSSYGAVEKTHFVMDHRRGRFRGFGFVTMESEGADEAIEQLDGSEFQGRKLKVSRAQSVENSARQSA